MGGSTGKVLHMIRDKAADSGSWLGSCVNSLDGSEHGFQLWPGMQLTNIPLLCREYLGGFYEDHACRGCEPSVFLRPKTVSMGEEFLIISRRKPVATISPVRKADSSHLAAKSRLFDRLRSQEVTGVRAWTRDELYVSTQ